MQQHFEAALQNIALWGDTDVFPLPFENHLFHDRKDQVVELLMEIHRNLDQALQRQPPFNESSLSLIGYTGFRWATQIDPLWNAYLLGLVIGLGDLIEAARIERDREVVFSYRYSYDATSHRLFNDSAWSEFQQRSVVLAGEFYRCRSRRLGSSPQASS